MDKIIEVGLEKFKRSDRLIAYFKQEYTFKSIKVTTLKQSDTIPELSLQEITYSVRRNVLKNNGKITPVAYYRK